MPYIYPSIPEFKGQFPGEFPYAVLPGSPGGSGAAISIVSASGLNGSILSSDVVLNSGGSGYTNGTPTIIVQNGGGTGCVLVPVISSGVITAVSLVGGGYGYTTPNTINVYISPGGDNTQLDKVTDFDIANAQVAALQFNVSQGLFLNQQAFTYAMNLLSAHYLCRIAGASQAGLAGKADWVTNSKTVGDVSESYTIPDRLLRSPFFSKLGSTTYGAQFLELLSPQLIGNTASYHRYTLA